MASSRVMSTTELASVLEISRSHALTLAARDAFPIPVIRLGRQVVVGRAAVEELLSVSSAA
jgi:hypothetical protein